MRRLDGQSGNRPDGPEIIRIRLKAGVNQESANKATIKCAGKMMMWIMFALFILNISELKMLVIGIVAIFALMVWFASKK